MTPFTELHIRRREERAEEARIGTILAEDRQRQRREEIAAEQREREAAQARRAERFAERREEVRPWKAKLDELRKLAERSAMGALREGDLDGAIDAHLRQEAAARLLPQFKAQLIERFPYPLYLEDFE